MEEFLKSLFLEEPLWVLLLVIVFFIYTLSKGADLLVEEAVALSVRWGVPTMLIGATIVSLGTTLPEAAVSVMAALQNQPGLALGNAVGSIICDTGLILGIAAIMKPLPLTRSILNRQGWIQIAAGFLLVLCCLPFGNMEQIFKKGGHLPQLVGLIFLILLVLYIWQSIRWAGKQEGGPCDLNEKSIEKADENLIKTLVKLFCGIALVLVSSKILIPTVEVTASRLNIPESIIAATLVAFGTSLPELVTAITAVRKGHGELAVGNVIGADILNVFFVAGAAASVTSGGLVAPPHFFQFLFPIMLAILIVFRIGVFVSGTHMNRVFGYILVSFYILVTIISYTLGIGAEGH